MFSKSTFLEIGHQNYDKKIELELELFLTWAHLKGNVQRQKNMGGVAALPPRKFSCLRKVFAHCYLINLFFDPFVLYAWKMCRCPGKFADYL